MLGITNLSITNLRTFVKFFNQLICVDFYPPPASLAGKHKHKTPDFLLLVQTLDNKYRERCVITIRKMFTNMTLNGNIKGEAVSKQMTPKSDTDMAVRGGLSVQLWAASVYFSLLAPKELL